MERSAVYRRKLGVIVEELEALPPPEADLSPLEMRGVLHAVQVAIDAAMDVIAMRVKDLGGDVSDDHHNIEVLVERGKLPADLALDRRALNGMRNAIVHKYNSFEEESLRDRLEMIRATLFRFAERMEEAA